jgi:hypothetical protein
MLEQDYTAERLARIKVLFVEATRKKTMIVGSQPALVRRLTADLDEMLKELRWSDPGR